MFGVAAAPIFDPEQKLPDFDDFMILFRPGDIVKFTPVTQTEYEDIQRQVTEGTFRYCMADVEFRLDEAIANPDEQNARLVEALR